MSQLAEVAKLSSEGVSLVAIKRILDLENYVVDMKMRVNELEKLVEELSQKQPGARVFAVGDGGTVSLPSGSRPKRSTSVVLWRRSQ